MKIENKSYPDTLRLTLKSTGETKEYNKTQVNVGRACWSDYCIMRRFFINRWHATFIYEQGKWFLRDNLSSNGTYINGKRLEPWEMYLLETGDEISFSMIETVIFR